MHRNIESLCCTPKTNIALLEKKKEKQNKYPNKLKEKEIIFGGKNRERSDLWLTDMGWEWGWGKWMKLVKRLELPVIQ